MTNLPNVNVPLVGKDLCPTRALLGLFPELSADAPAVDQNGAATATLRAQLQTAIGGALPNAFAALVNADGTPTRVMTALLQRLP